MRLGIVLTPWLLMCIGASAGPASRPAAGSTPKVGQQAHEVALKTPGEQEVRLSALREMGPVVLIVLRGWVGYQCPVCTKQVGEFVGKAKQFEGKGAAVLLVYPGAGEHLKEHAADSAPGKGLPANFHFVLDPDFQFTNTWGLRWNVKGETAYPSTFVIDRQGVVRFVKTSHSHGGRASAAEVLKVLDQVK